MRVQPSILRRLNERRVMNAIRLGGTVSRADINRSLKLTMPTVSKIVDDLIRQGWVRETGIAESPLGRPPMMLEIDPHGAMAVGIDLGVSRARIVCVNLLAEVVREDEVSSDAIPDKEALLMFIDRALDVFGVDRKLIIGMGLAAPGSPNPRPSEPQRPQYLDEHPMHRWQRDGIDRLLTGHFEVPAWVENDANAAVLGEMWFGEGSNAGHLLFVIDDAGVGAGIAVNGSIFRGEHNVAGEFSHMIVNADREVDCDCGRPGCLSSLARPGAIYHALERAGVARERSRRERPLRDILVSAQAGEEPERSIVASVFSYMSAGIVNIVDVIDPSMVVLGGSFFESDPYTVTEVSRRVQEVMHPKVVRVVPSAFGANAVAVGAATLALQHVYDHTKVMHPVDASSEVALVTV